MLAYDHSSSSPAGVVCFFCLPPAFVIIPLSVGPCRLSLQIFPFLNFLKFYVVCPFTYRLACLFTLYFWVVFLLQIFKCNCMKRHIAEVCFNCGQLNTWNLKPFYFILILRCCLFEIKEAVLFFSCLFLLVFHCGCGCLMPFMPL